MLSRSRIELPRAVAAACLAIAAMLALGACGGSDSDAGEIPPATAEGLQGALSDLEGAIVAGSCSDARAAVDRFGERLEAMGAVTEDVAERLGEGAAQLETLVQRDMCMPSGTTGPDTVAPPPTTTTTTGETTTEEDEAGDESGGAKPPKPPKPPNDEGGPNAPPGPPGNPGQPPTEETDEGATDSTDETNGIDGTGGTGASEEAD